MLVYKIIFKTDRGVLSKLESDYDKAAEIFNFWSERLDEDKMDGCETHYVQLVQIDYRGDKVLSVHR